MLLHLKYLKKAKYKDKDGNKVEEESMAAMVIVNHNTGEVVASGAGIGEKRLRTKIGYLNIPTQLYKSTGSSMKPISVIAPGLETGSLTGAKTALRVPITSLAAPDDILFHSSRRSPADSPL